MSQLESRMLNLELCAERLEIEKEERGGLSLSGNLLSWQNAACGWGHDRSKSDTK